jgi:uncharacterized protein (DUF2147 family)
MLNQKNILFFRKINPFNMKRFTSSLLVLLFFSSFLLAQSSPGDKIIGVYLTAKKTSQVRIFQATDNKYYGKLAWMDKNKERKDSLNPDPKLKTEKIFGMLLLKGLVYNEKSKQWENGTVYDPDNGKTYTCYLWFDEKDPQILHLKGYILGMRFIGRESDWIREAKLRD